MFDRTEALNKCIGTKEGASQAQEFAENSCKPLLAAWRSLCEREIGLECDQHLVLIYEIAGRKPRAVLYDELGRTPFQRYFAGLPPLGLPDLRYPIHIRPGAVVCRSEGMLGNPNRDITLFIGACRYAPSTPIRIRVYVPRTAEAYMSASVHQIAQVVWDVAEISAAGINSGWVRMSDLEGKR